MDIVISVLIGAVAGGISLLFNKSCRASDRSALAVGILGALLGMVSNVWVGSATGIGGPATSCVGAFLALLLWPMAQKLLHATALPGEQD